MKIGFATDRGGYILKEQLLKALRDAGHEVQDFSAYTLDSEDDYLDFVIPLTKAVAQGKVERGIAICGSGVGASFTMNKVSGVWSTLTHESFSAHQDAEDGDMNLLYPHEVAVLIEVYHLCVEMRGVREMAPTTRTTVWRGHFAKDATLRSEFFSACKFQHDEK